MLDFRIASYQKKKISDPEMELNEAIKNFNLQLELEI